MRRAVRIALVVALSLPAGVQARRLPVPAEQATPNAVLWLARGMIAEAGWYAERDHRGIAFVLARRWRVIVRRFPTLRLSYVIRRYCSALESAGRTPTARQRWLRALSGPQMPAGWPAHKASWPKHRPLWRAALDRSAAFFRGELRDPCKGRARHWGGNIDVGIATRKRLVEVDCGETRNTFYRLPSKKVDPIEKKPDAGSVTSTQGPLEAGPEVNHE